MERMLEHNLLPHTMFPGTTILYTIPPTRSIGRITLDGQIVLCKSKAKDSYQIQLCFLPFVLVEERLHLYTTTKVATMTMISTTNAPTPIAM